jgi:hypothetical protein
MTQHQDDLSELTIPQQELGIGIVENRGIQVPCRLC